MLRLPGTPRSTGLRGQARASPGGDRFRIGPWKVEPASGKLRSSDGEERHLRPQEMDLLSLLAAAGGRVVSREEILRAVWDDAAVEEGAITRCVSEIRKALGDEAKTPHYIETIPKRGYRLVAPVEREPPEPDAVTPESAATGRAEPGWKRRGLGGLGRHALAATVILTAVALGSGPEPASVPASEDRPAVAVLGFSNLSGAEEWDWLSTALTEMLATELASGTDLRVVAGETVSLMKRDLSLTTAESLAPETLQRIRANLGADLVVVGSYLAQEGTGRSELRLDLKLQETASGNTVSGLAASGSLDRLADLVSTAGVRLRERLGSAPPDRSWTPPASHLPGDPETVRRYAEGLGKLRRFEAAAARDLLLEAVDREPQQPLAHLALAEAWAALGHDARAVEAARRAHELRADLPRELQLWIEASYLAKTGRWDEAIGLYDALWVFAPENLEYGLRLAQTHNAASRPADALATVERIRRQAGPAHRDPRLSLVTADAARLLGDNDRSLSEATTAVELGERLAAPSVVARGRLNRARALHALGRLAEAVTAQEEARAAFAAAGDRRSEAGAQRDLAGWLTVRGSFERAKALATRSLATYRAIGDRAGEAGSLRAIAELEWRTGDWGAAEAALRHSMAIYRETNDRGGEAAVLQTLGVLEGSRRGLSAAAKFFGESLAIHREIGNRASVAAALGNLGKLHLLQAAPAEAEVHLREAESLARELGLKNGLANVRFNQGYGSWLSGDPRRGAAAFTEAIDLYRRLENPLMVAASLQGLGEVHLLRGELAAARASIEEALARRVEIARKEGAVGNSAMESHAALSAVLLELGHFEAAERTARTAVETLRHPTALNALARVLLARGRIAEAESLSAEAGELLEAIAGVNDITLRHLVLAACIQAAAGDRERAREALEGVIAEALARGAWTLYAEAELHLGEIEIGSGDPRSGEARLAALEADARSREAHLLADKARQARQRPAADRGLRETRGNAAQQALTIATRGSPESNAIEAFTSRRA